MPDVFRVDLVGLQELDRRLGELDRRMAVKELRGAVSFAMKPVVDGAKARAPVNTGALKASIRFGSRVRGKTLTGFVFPDGKSKRALAIYNADRALKGKKAVRRLSHFHFQEFGVPARGIPARPFLRPAFDQNRNKIIRRFSDNLRKRLDRVRKK